MSSPFRTPKPPSKGQRLPPSGSKTSAKGSSAQKENEQTQPNKSERKEGLRSAAKAPKSPVTQTAASPATVTNVGTPRDAAKPAGTESPFKEWATGALDCLEMVSPGTAGSLMSPSFAGISVKIESSPLPTSTQEDVMSMCKTTSLHPSLQESNTSAFPLNLNQAFKNGNAEESVVDFEAMAAQVEDQPGMRKYRLQMCEEFSFELFEGSIVALGFNPPSHPPSTVRSKRVNGGIPITPATHSSEHSEGRTTGDSSNRKRVCNCKKSKCLKLYCECFSAGVLCGGCKCVDCANDGGHEEERLTAMQSIKQRNHNAFAPKFVSETQDQEEDKGVHARGCRCKKSHCLKKYCECFQAGVKCSDKCKCEECKNKGDENSTPRERTEAVLNAIPTSGSLSASPYSGKRTGLPECLSPLRNKKPRVLDFNVTSTPGVNGSIPEHGQGSPEQFSDEESGPRRPDLHALPPFGSPSSIFLQMPTA